MLQPFNSIITCISCCAFLIFIIKTPSSFVPLPILYSHLHTSLPVKTRSSDTRPCCWKQFHLPTLGPGLLKVGMWNICFIAGLFHPAFPDAGLCSKAILSLHIPRPFPWPAHAAAHTTQCSQPSAQDSTPHLCPNCRILPGVIFLFYFVFLKEWKSSELKYWWERKGAGFCFIG